MHKGHLTGCAIAFGLALVVFTVTGGSIGGLGLLLAVLICPLTMGVAMWFLMGSQRHAHDVAATRNAAHQTEGGITTVEVTGDLRG